ncbi:MAG TPA: hypothetical protein VEJ86_00690 [Candidatus Binataceae bacterium]|nr:hypothetical protein [Candidatus Binataceae bacterium]
MPENAAATGGDARPFPDIILRSQFFELVGRRALSSEQRLMLAVLADAINIVQECCHSPNPRKRAAFQEAWEWFFATGTRSPLSFEHVCDALGIDCPALRSRLQAMVSDENPRANRMRLRLKEASRIQRLTANRVRRRSRRPRVVVTQSR